MIQKRPLNQEESSISDLTEIKTEGHGKRIDWIGFWRRRGSSLVGYGLIVGLISVLALGAIGVVGDQVDTLFRGVGDTLETSLNESGLLPPPPPSDPCASENDPSPGTSCENGAIFAVPSFDVGGIPSAQLWVTPFSAVVSRTARPSEPPQANCNNGNGSCYDGQTYTQQMSFASVPDTPASDYCSCLGKGNPEDGWVGGIPLNDAEEPICPETNPSGFGYSDWYLPSLAEMEALYSVGVSPDDPDNPVDIHGCTSACGVQARPGDSGEPAGQTGSRNGPLASLFSESLYWTSSDGFGDFPNQHWAYNMSNGQQDLAFGTTNLLVHCIRKD